MSARVKKSSSKADSSSAKPDADKSAAKSPASAAPKPKKKKLSLAADRDLASVIKLGSVMDLSMAAALKSDILEVIDAANGMGVDAAEVESLTTPCVQVLVAAGLAMEQRDQDFFIDNATPAVRAAFVDLGLGSNFERWSKTK